MQDLSETNNSLETLEQVAVYGSIAGSFAAVVLSFMNLHPFAFASASLPLSASAMLNYKNRKEFVKKYVETQAKQDDSIESLMQATAKHNSTLEEHSSYLCDHTVHLVEITGDNHFKQKAIDSNTVEIEQLKQATKELTLTQAKLEVSLQAIEQVESLSTQANSYTEQFYHRRGLMNQRFGNDYAAIKDFTEAIRINTKNANAYHNRGILRSQLGEKQGAVDDLRTAAKFYFEQGDLENYEKAKSLSLSIHGIEFNLEAVTTESLKKKETVLVGSLFS
jgi:tetratricopeptide (TPR) repeat protein